MIFLLGPGSLFSLGLLCCLLPCFEMAGAGAGAGAVAVAVALGMAEQPTE